MVTTIEACRDFLNRHRMEWEELDQGLGIAFVHRGERFLLLDYKEADPGCFQLILPCIFQSFPAQHDRVYRTMNAINEDRKYVKLYMDDSGAVNAECQMILGSEPELDRFFFRLVDCLHFEGEHFARYLSAADPV